MQAATASHDVDRATASHDVDPVTLALVQNRLDHVARQMGWVMVRTSRSPIFNQSHDFSCFITDRDGTLVSQADGIPIHTGGGGFAIRAVLKSFGGNIAEGDVFLLNDPYVAGGNHLPDWVIARPVFAGGDLTAFACNRAHQSDIGGGAAGTYNPEATEIFHEGIRLPVLKLIEHGVTRNDLWQLLLLNTRCPELLDGDLRAMLGSTQIGAEQIADLVKELIEDFGANAAAKCFAAILDHGERRLRTALAAMPHGTWRAEESYDTDCFVPADIRIRVAVTLDADGATVDFTGTDPQIRGFKNSSLANTHSAVYAAFASFFATDIPRNEGTFRAIRIIAPEGSLVNARAPAPLTMCTVFPAHEIMHICWWALGQADPARNIAGWGKNAFPVSSGTRAGGTTWVLYHWGGGSGAGAVAGRDGFNQMGPMITLGGLVIPNAETYEQLYPVRVHRQEFRCDAAGPGEWRGGTGVEYEAEIDSEAVYSFRGEGVGRATGKGVEHGGDGAGGTLAVHGRDGSVLSPPQYALLRLGASRLVMQSPGGGGFGDPLDRDPALVARDVRDGVVSNAAAVAVYAVQLAADCSVDPIATEHMRRARRKAG
jgi:N-methylhydantoinase B